MQRGTDFSIMLGRVELMNSRMSGSEEALADLACERLVERRRPRILVGGLGMGFTLRRLLGQLGPEASVEVAELVPAIVEWGRGPLAGLFGDCLDDPRVAVTIRDVGSAIREARGLYDAILLDVDNGPEGLTRAGNDALYDAAGLGAAFRSLRPGGVLAVWSTAPDRAFADRMRRSGLRVEEHRVRERGAKGGARHIVWTGIAPRG